MLEIKNLSKSYGSVKAVKNISLTVKEGEIFGFIGPNGAGKSTTIRCIMDLLNKDKGSIYFQGEEIKRNKTHLKEKIGYLPTEVNLYQEMTGKELLEYNDKFYSFDCLKKAKRLSKILDFDVNKKIETLSMGNLKKLGIILSLMHDPKLIIMDEPSSGLDPLIQEKFYELLKEEKAQGKTIFFSSHNLFEVSKICDEVAIIKNGEILKKEEMKSLLNRKIITIETKDLKKLPKKIIDKEISRTDEKIVFTFTGDYNELLKALKEIKINNILIEEPSLEEMFLSYYMEK